MGCGDASTEWREEDGFRWRELRLRGGAAGFTPVPASETGIGFVNALSEDSLVRNETLSHGSGVALGDYDGDGRTDIYLGSVQGPNALYRNLGDWRFEDVAAAVGADLPDRITRGVVFADVDGDGDVDSWADRAASR